MFKINNRLVLSKNVKRLDILAPTIARKAQPGQFVALILEEGREAIPLAIAETDPSRGMLSVIFREQSDVTRRLGEMSIDEPIFALTGPLGRPATIQKYGTVLCVATGLGAAQILPVCRALKDKGNKVISVQGGRTRSSLMLEPQIRMASYKMFIATEDGTFERRGVATDIVDDILKRETIKAVYAAGSVDMMERVCGMTRAKKIKTFIQIGAGIKCGLGVCAGCRLDVGGQTVFACQDGPEFDGHEVDFSALRVRLAGKEKLRRSETTVSGEPDQATQVVKKFFPGTLSQG